ncbi:MAG: hypothetical protein J6N70_11735 [Oribacterium sp.]|jgi:hypothetical protein|nr:hypothetical protein [Oribacterium sp.]
MNDMSLKAKIRNIAIEKNVSASAVLQNYLIRALIKHEPMPKAPKWHFWVRKENRRDA